MNLKNYVITVNCEGINRYPEVRQHVQTARNYREVLELVADWIEDTGIIVNGVQIAPQTGGPVYLFNEVRTP